MFTIRIYFRNRFIPPAKSEFRIWPNEWQERSVGHTTYRAPRQLWTSKPPSGLQLFLLQSEPGRLLSFLLFLAFLLPVWWSIYQTVTWPCMFGKVKKTYSFNSWLNWGGGEDMTFLSTTCTIYEGTGGLVPRDDIHHQYTEEDQLYPLLCLSRCTFSEKKSCIRLWNLHNTEITGVQQQPWLILDMYRSRHYKWKNLH